MSRFRVTDRLRSVLPHRQHEGSARPSSMNRLSSGDVAVLRRGDPPSWALALFRNRGTRFLGSVVIALIALALIVAVSGVRVTRGDVGTVAVVRNGGPLDTRSIRQIIMPGQGLTYIGMFSQSPHVYPAAHVTLRYMTFGLPPARPTPASETMQLPTKDGVLVGIDATVFLRFIGDHDIEMLKRFDVGPGTRQFPTPDGQELYPWDSPDGFNAMLDALFRPVLDNDMRKELGRFPCAALVSSCALVKGGSVDLAQTNRNIGRIEDRINSSLEDDLELALGQHYFYDIRLRIGQVTLPTGVQEAINDAQAEYADVNAARAELRQARYQAKSNRLLGRTYNDSPGLTTIETMKSIPKGSTVIVAPGGGRKPLVLAGANPSASAVPPDQDQGTQGDSTTGTGADGSTATVPGE
jgi:regulator of protease activity HflC (stomatin/prohibitin superfamily)